MKRDVVLLEAGKQEGEDEPAHRHAIALGAVSPEELFAGARAFYGDGRVDSVELVAECAVTLEAELRRLGWRMAEEEPALVLTDVPGALEAAQSGLPIDLTIKRVEDEVGLEAFYSVSGTGRRWVPSVEAARDPNVALLVGYVDGKAVSTSRVSGHGEVADLMGVVTVPELRRRGYGTAMTWAAVRAAREMGCGVCVLTASEMGYPVYVKMGFVRVCTLRTYVPGVA